MYKVFGLLGLEVSRGAVQESIQSSTTPDPGYQLESDKLKVRHHKREPRGAALSQ